MADEQDFKRCGRTFADVDAAAARFAWPPGVALGGAREVLERWLVSDVAPGRLMPWMPIAFGFGVVLYFTAEREP